MFKKVAMSDNCTFPACEQFKKPGSVYCYGHERLMGSKSDKPAVAPTPQIAKVSDNMKEQLKVYKKLSREFLKKHYQCQVKGCNNASQCVHHKAGRIGENLTDVRKFLAVCFEHHRQIEDNPDWAYENNYSESRLNQPA